MKPTISPPTFAGLEIIGDVHGEYGLLVGLLKKLGYEGGDPNQLDRPWKHRERKAVFVGDLIDRGAEIPRVLRLVRAMVQEGHALAVIGNHELFPSPAEHNGHFPLARYLRCVAKTRRLPRPRPRSRAGHRRPHAQTA